LDVGEGERWPAYLLASGLRGIQESKGSREQARNE
jgi:hypothetical protein